MDFRQKLGQFIAGEADHAKIFTAITLASFRPEGAEMSRLRAVRMIDEFWKMDAKRLNKNLAERFVESVWADDRFPLLHALGANHNKMVNNGTRQFYRMMTGQAGNSAGGAAIGTLPTYIQLGLDGTPTTNPSTNNLGCYSPITSTGMAVAASLTPVPVTTDTNYTNDTVQWQKTDFNNGTGSTIRVKEVAILNNDAVKIAWARTAVTDTDVAAGGNLSVTYQFQIKPS